MQAQPSQQQQLTPETLQQFTRVCQSATQLMLSYKQQSQDLKNEITSMVTIYNKTASPNEAVPVEQIMQITTEYEQEMRNAHREYEVLETELRREEQERNGMMREIEECFGKLERMDKLIKEKKAKGEAKGEAKSEVPDSAESTKQGKRQ